MSSEVVHGPPETRSASAGLPGSFFCLPCFSTYAAQAVENSEARQRDAIILRKGTAAIAICNGQHCAALSSSCIKRSQEALEVRHLRAVLFAEGGKGLREHNRRTCQLVRRAAPDNTPTQEVYLDYPTRAGGGLSKHVGLAVADDKAQATCH